MLHLQRNLWEGEGSCKAQYLFFCPTHPLARSHIALSTNPDKSPGGKKKKKDSREISNHEILHQVGVTNAGTENTASFAPPR